ncbi:hypothetical protein B0A48_13723 [Cryoendolithus antarcticus]|uniref:F-box domain-containing protein n=1 Tax=Cryoendolithus antarcticus TaxID=1507870 RepID=A0A1V8SMI2_9PEZI|nr:hypothetical protein B0A48_13723 [Cryoendolithus antarcticus]
MGSVSKHCLEALPGELLDSIIEPLELDDICNIRLCSRTLAAKAVQGRYKAYFYRKTVKINQKFLLDFERVTKSSGLGCLVQDLILAGVLDEKRARTSSSEELDLLYLSTKKPRDLISLLCDCLQNIVNARGVYAVKTIAIRVLDERSNKPGTSYKDYYNNTPIRWRPGWSCASVTFHIVVASLLGSGMMAEELRAFNDFDTQRCSLSSNTVCAILSCGQSGNVFHMIKRLSLNLYDPEFVSSFDGLRMVLESSPQLEDLELDQFWIGPGNAQGTRFSPGVPYDPASEASLLPAGAEQHLSKAFERASTARRLPSLKKLRLSGLYTAENSLVRFVQRTSSRHFCMLRIKLTAGNFRLLFDHCTASGSMIGSVECEDLREPGGNVLFDDPTANLKYSRRQLKRESEAIESPIRYYILGPHWVQDSGLWRVKREHEIQHRYGPL